jgi:serine/threonine protein kinase
MATRGTVHDIDGVAWVVGDHVGRGATCDVVRAVASDGRVVVLKVYRVFQEGKEAIAMSDIVSKEARMMKEWKHPCIVKGFGMKLPETAQANAVLAMEFMEKGSIDRCIGSVSPEQRVLAILRATLAVDFMHSNGVIHGDIKPTNLLMDGEFNAKLSDFGSSRAADGSMTTNVANTAAYAPAEVLQGGSPTVESDVY